MTTSRGPYGKSSARRQKIIEAALAAYAEAGSRKVSVRDIAHRVGMTDAGVLHHFGSREALLTAVLQARDVEDEKTFGAVAAEPRAGARIVAHNASTPGLVKLFVDMAAAAAEPEHPAHDFFADRYRRYRDHLATRLESDASGPGGDTSGPEGDASAGPRHAAAPSSGIDPARAARILLAAVDGLQLQWLLEPGIDMAADVAALHEVLVDAIRVRQGGAGAV